MLETLSLSPEAMADGLNPERDQEGHIEYKLKLSATTPERFDRLVTQLRWRLHEGRSVGASGQAIYELGVRDDGALVGLGQADLTDSLETLERMADKLNAHVSVLRKIQIDPTAPLRARAPLPPGRRSRRPRPSTNSDTPRTSSSDPTPATPPDVSPSHRERILDADDPIDLLLDDTLDPWQDAFPACTDLFRWVSPTMVDEQRRAEADALALAKHLASEAKWEKKLAKRAARSSRRELGLPELPLPLPPSPVSTALPLPIRPSKAAAKLRPTSATEPRYVVEVLVVRDDLPDVGDLSTDFALPLLL